jgi:serine/threonine-protein kinase
MGVVYKALQTGRNRLVAIKKIRARDEPELITRWKIEARAMASLDHPHIVRIYDIVPLEGVASLVLEYIEGESLAKKLEGGPLRWQEAASLVETLARTIYYAHARGIVHRDLKPANILLTKEGFPKIIDFGLAKLLRSPGRRTRSRVVVGTPAYMAPEQASGDSQDVGPAADVYSLGAILYECLTGSPPSQGETQDEWRHQVPVRKLVKDVPEKLEAVCLKCLQKSPKERCADAMELAENLRKLLKGI